MPHVRDVDTSWGSSSKGDSPANAATNFKIEEERQTLSRGGSVTERAAMFKQRESDPPVVASGNGGTLALSGGRVGRVRGGGHQPVSRQQQTRSGEARGGAYRGSSSTHEAAARCPPSYPEETLTRGTGSSFSSSHRDVVDRSSREGEGGGSGGGGGGGARGGRGGSSFANFLPTQDIVNSSASDYDDGTTSLDSTPRRTDELRSRSSSFSATSPYNSTDGVGGDGNQRIIGGAGGGGGGGGSTGSGSNAGVCTAVSKNKKMGSPSSVLSSPPPASATGSGGSSPAGSIRSIPGVSARPGGVPFGASALSKALPNNGRGRPRGLRPRHSFGSTSGGNNRLPSSSSVASSSSRSASLGSRGGVRPPPRHRDSGGSSGAREAERRAAGVVAPGVPVNVVVSSAIKIESVMRVLIARGYVRRKLVSEVTAFSLIMERGIEVIKVCVCQCVCVCVHVRVCLLDNGTRDGEGGGVRGEDVL